MSGEIAVGFFRHGTEVLLIRRDDRFSGRWDAVSVRSESGGARFEFTVSGT